MDKELVKQDINFLENPIWFQDKCLAEKSEDGSVWKDRDGYIYRAGYKIPIKIDILFLYYLLFYSQQENWKAEIVLSRYKVLKNCGLTFVPYWYKRLEDSLDRWQSVNIKFQGTFYDGKEYQIMSFGIIDEWRIEKETKCLIIRFNPTWLTTIKESNYFKLIDFEIIKTLRSPLVIRLYEILIKTFQSRNVWEIDAVKLAKKIPMQEQYPAHIILKIEAAVKRINENSTLNLSLNINRPKRGKALFIFTKIIKEKQELSTTFGVELSEDDSFKVIVKLLPQEHQNKKTILRVIDNMYKKHGYDYVARNIKYTNKNCTKNYRAYLVKAFKEDWGEEVIEDLAASKKVSEKEKEFKKIEKEYKRYKESIFSDYVKQLPDEEYKQELEEIITQICKTNPIIKDRSKNIQRQIAEETLYSRWIEQKKVKLKSFNEWKKTNNNLPS